MIRSICLLTFAVALSPLPAYASSELRTDMTKVENEALKLPDGKERTWTAERMRAATPMPLPVVDYSLPVPAVVGTVPPRPDKTEE